MRTVVPTYTPRRAVAAYDSYEEAQRAVDRLSDQGFPVEKVAIVGGPQYVERRGGLTIEARRCSARPRRAHRWRLRGPVGAVLHVRPEPAVPLLILYGVVVGAIFGAILGAVLHAATGGNATSRPWPGCGRTATRSWSTRSRRARRNGPERQSVRPLMATTYALRAVRTGPARTITTEVLAAEAGVHPDLVDRLVRLGLLEPGPYPRDAGGAVRPRRAPAPRPRPQLRRGDPRLRAADPDRRAGGPAALAGSPATPNRISVPPRGRAKRSAALPPPTKSSTKLRRPPARVGQPAGPVAIASSPAASARSRSAATRACADTLADADHHGGADRGRRRGDRCLDIALAVDVGDHALRHGGDRRILQHLADGVRMAPRHVRDRTRQASTRRAVDAHVELAQARTPHRR